MAKFAKNYLPIMFNLYTMDTKIDESIRQSLLDTIKLYVKVADRELVNVYISQAMKTYANFAKLHEDSIKSTLNNSGTAAAAGDGHKTKGVVFDFNKTESTTKSSKSSPVSQQPEIKPFLFSKYAFLDIIGALAGYSNEANIGLVYELARNGITNEALLDKTLQKKSYKILDSILATRLVNGNGNDNDDDEAKSPAIKTFVEAHFESIAATLVRSLTSCNSAAKVPRLKCLLALMGYVKSSQHKNLIRQILPEVILCIREVNHKSRDASAALLNSMLRLWQKLGLEATTSVTETGRGFYNKKHRHIDI
jgi:ribosomal RNA-processing protein 12